MPARILEFASYQAMIACVAAGTGFAVVPKSVLEALRATRNVRQHMLPKRVAHNRTFIVWNSEPSPSLNGLLALLASSPDRALSSLQRSDGDRAPCTRVISSAV
jgi:DNA-binding transcriptional LysR family regulator